MKKLLLFLLVFISSFALCSCNGFNFGPNSNSANLTNQVAEENIYQRICNDMNNVANTLRSLDILYYENYAISSTAGPPSIGSP